MERSTTLTAYLARAAGTNAVETVVDERPERVVTEERADTDEDGRCTASVISGQRCRRPAAVGHELCPGHIAMGTKVPTLR